MKKTRPTRWYHRLFYRWSMPYRHDIDQGYRWYKAQGYTEGYNDCLNHAPWPYETHTDPLQPVAPLPGTLVLHTPPGEFTKAVRCQPGHNTESQILKALPTLQATGKMQRAELQRKMQERDALRKKEGHH